MSNTMWVVIVIVLIPYIVAFLFGLGNGTLFKFRNLNIYIGAKHLCQYRLRRSGFAVLFHTISYTVASVCFLSMSSIIIASQTFSMDIAVGVSVICILSVLSAYSVSFIFCDMAICNNKLYMYSISTLFKVVIINIEDINSWHTFGPVLSTSVCFSTLNSKYVFHCVDRYWEFESAIERIKGS